MNRSVVGGFLTTILLVLAFSTLTCKKSSNPVGPGGGGTADVLITIQSGSSLAGASAYSPNPATLLAGQTVAWKNNDAMTHTATAGDAAFNVSVAAGATSSPITVAAGTHSYVCAVAGHNMTASLTAN